MSYTAGFYVVLASWWFIGLAVFAFVPRLRRLNERNEGGTGCLWVLGGYVIILVGGFALAALLSFMGVDIS